MKTFRLRAISCQPDGGVTLIETMAAMVVFALVAAAGAAMLLTGIHVSGTTRNRSQAATLASSAIETFRNSASHPCAWESPLPSTCKVPAGVVPPGNTTSTQTVGNTSYTIEQSTEFEAKATSQTACNASTQGGSSGVQPVLLVTDSVTWAHMGATKPVTSQTILTPPVGAFSNNTGAIDVGVVNSLNQPVPGVSVSVTSASGVVSSYITDSNGCALAAFLTPGSYTVTVVQSGYVDNQENATSTQTIGVTTGTVSTATFFYDQAATLGATFVKASSYPAGATLQFPTALAVTVANSGLAGTGTYQLPNGTTGSAVYPYASGYSIWAGHCPEANPDAVGTAGSPLWSNPAPAPSTVTTPASSTVTASVPLYPLTINYEDAGNAAETFTVNEQAGSAKTQCTAASLQTYTLPGNPVGSSITAQSYVAGLPLGTYTLTAKGTSTQTATVVVGLNGATATVNT